MSPIWAAMVEPSHGASLLERARNGDEAAWLEIVVAVGPRLTGFARARGVSEAEDLMQDVLLAAAIRLRDFEGEWKDFRAWLFTMAYRRVADHHRKAARRPELLPLPAAALRPGDAGPEERAIERSEAARCLALLDELAPLERDVMVLRVVAELDTETVASVVGKRAGHVRVIQSRAAAKIRRRLEEEERHGV